MTGISKVLGRVDPAESYLLVTCNVCGHEFIAMYLPQPLRAAADMMGRLFCPLCGNMKLLMSDNMKTVPLKGAKAAR